MTAILSDDDVALVTATEGARRLGMSAATIRCWKRREWLQVHDWTQRGAPLFSLRELWDLEHALRLYGRASTANLDRARPVCNATRSATSLP